MRVLRFWLVALYCLLASASLFGGGAFAQGYSERDEAFESVSPWVKQGDYAASQPVWSPEGCERILLRQRPTETTYQIVNLPTLNCFYYRSKLVFSAAETRDFQYIVSRTADHVWVAQTSAIGTRLTWLGRGRSSEMTLPPQNDNWRITETYNGGPAYALLRRRIDGRAIGAVQFDPEAARFVVFQRPSNPSQLFSLRSAWAVTIDETCDAGAVVARAIGTCIIRDDRGENPFYQVGNCAQGTRPAIYIQGGPFGPSVPLWRYDTVKPLFGLPNLDTQGTNPCVWFPRIATSGEDLTNTVFTNAIAQNNAQIVSLVSQSRIGNSNSPALVIAEFFGSQSITDLVQTDAPLDIVFFSSLLDERGFAQTRGSITGMSGLKNMTAKQRQVIIEDVSKSMRAQLARPSNWRLGDYFLWMETVQTPILQRACARLAPTRIVVLRATYDPRGTSQPEVDAAARATCAQNGHRLEFVNAPGSGHVTKDVAAYGNANSALLREMVADYTR